MENTVQCYEKQDGAGVDCVCKPNWFGKSNFQRSCFSECRCSDYGTEKCNDGENGDGTCTCKSGFMPPICDSCLFHYYPEGECNIHRVCTSATTCNGHGKCDYDDGRCDCDSKYAGPDCTCQVSLKRTDSCSGRGLCNEADDGGCLCDARWSGETCESLSQNEDANEQCEVECGRRPGWG